MDHDILHVQNVETSMTVAGDSVTTFPSFKMSFEQKKLSLPWKLIVHTFFGWKHMVVVIGGTLCQLKIRNIPRFHAG